MPTTSPNPAVETVARAICVGRGLSPDCLHQHNFEGDWPEDDRREYNDAFTGEPRVMLFHKGWRRYEKDASNAIAAINATRPATASADYAQFFYDLAALMGLSAQPRSPKEVWEGEMLPRITAALSVADAEGWRDIASAPKDGLVDLWVVFTDYEGNDRGGRVVNCKWRNESLSYRDGWHDQFSNAQEWAADLTDPDNEGAHPRNGRRVTHWRPLPAPPATLTKDNRDG